MMAKGMGAVAREYDITPAIHPFKETTDLSESGLVVFASPVYCGRIPQVAVRRMKRFVGRDTPAVVVAVYGNRNYDDSLAELQDLAMENGFRVIAAAACVAQHTYASTVAPGRPDPEDWLRLENFGAQVEGKLEAFNPSWTENVKIKGKRPYCDPIRLTPCTPTTIDSCTLCGTCAWHCPAAAIPFDTPNVTLADACISCGRCIKVCPDRSRRFHPESLRSVIHFLETSAADKRQNEFFLELDDFKISVIIKSYTVFRRK
jgi:Dissimilatory sulfite reductase (desulfoviridin), alpha and beta subunits